MSFRSIFDRFTRIARAEINAGRRSASYEEELRRAEELIAQSRRASEPETVEKGEKEAREETPHEATADDIAYEEACRIIGVSPGATMEEITRAYRLRAKQLHPDRRTHLTPDEQRRAHALTQQLNAAYETLKRRPL